MDLICRDVAALEIEKYFCSICELSSERDPHCKDFCCVDGHEVLKSVPSVNCFKPAETALKCSLAKPRMRGVEGDKEDPIGVDGTYGRDPRR